MLNCHPGTPKWDDLNKIQRESIFLSPFFFTLFVIIKSVYILPHQHLKAKEKGVPRTVHVEIGVKTGQQINPSREENQRAI